MLNLDLRVPSKVLYCLDKYLELFSMCCRLLTAIYDKYPKNRILTADKIILFIIILRVEIKLKYYEDNY